jgi:hypothetical protein
MCKRKHNLIVSSHYFFFSYEVLMPRQFVLFFTFSVVLFSVVSKKVAKLQYQHLRRAFVLRRAYFLRVSQARHCQCLPNPAALVVQAAVFHLHRQLT